MRLPEREANELSRVRIRLGECIAEADRIQAPWLTQELKEIRAIIRDDIMSNAPTINEPVSELLEDWIANAASVIDEHSGSADLIALVAEAKERAAILGVAWDDDLVPEWVRESTATVFEVFDMEDGRTMTIDLGEEA